MIKHNHLTNELDYGISEVIGFDNENVNSILKPEKLFADKSVLRDIKPGDSIEICP